MTIMKGGRGERVEERRERRMEEEKDVEEIFIKKGDKKKEKYGRKVKEI